MLDFNKVLVKMDGTNLVEFDFDEKLFGTTAPLPEDLFNDTKAFRIKEIDSEFRLEVDSVGNPRGLANEAFGEFSKEVERITNPIPVAKTELSASEIEAPFVGSLDQIPISLLTSRSETLFYDNSMRDRLKRELIKTPEYKTMFNYIFPLENYASLVTIHSIILSALACMTIYSKNVLPKFL